MDVPKLRRKFSIGLTLAQMGPDDYRRIIDAYHEYWRDIYFSPPFGDQYHSRLAVREGLKPSPVIERTVFDLLAHGLKRGIQVDMVLNTQHLTPQDILLAIRRARDWVDISRITTLAEYARVIKGAYPDIPLTCSYNEGVKGEARLREIHALGYFDTIVLGNAAIRNFRLFAQAHDRGLKVKFLVNNGCSFACVAFCNPTDQCWPIFERTLDARGDVNALYAEQSIMPWELHRYYVDCPFIDGFKISCRPSSYKWLFNCLRSYIRNMDEEMVYGNKDCYHYWARLSHFQRHFGKLEYHLIQAHKEAIWSKLETCSEAEAR